DGAEDGGLEEIHAGRPARRRTRSGPRVMGSIDAPEHVADLAERGARLHGIDRRLDQIELPPRRLLERVEGVLREILVARRLERAHTLALLLLEPSVERKGRLRRVLGISEAVHAHYDLLSLLHLQLRFVGALLDRPRLVARLDPADRASHGIDRLDLRARFALDPVRPLLDRGSTADGVHGVGHAGLPGEDLLGAERRRGGLLARE